MFGDNQEAVVEAEEVRAEEEEEEEQGQVEYKVCLFMRCKHPCLRPHLCHINMKKD